MEAMILRLWNELRTVGIGDILDVLTIAYVIYLVLSALRKTSAGSVMKGVLLLLAVLVLSNLLQMNVINYLTSQLVQMAVVILVILFQPELRRLLEQAGSSRLILFGGKKAEGNIGLMLDAVVTACTDMAKTHTGALIVFERDLRLSDYAATGTYVGATVTSELIKSIFFPNSPLHDGAVLISEDRIVAARCMLPMSSNPALSSELGMRHKAGIGLSERSDAVCAIVSEETGAISVAVDGMLKRRLDPETFRSLLHKELIGESEQKRGKGRLKNRRAKP